MAGQQLQKTRSAKRTNQGPSIETSRFVDLLNIRRVQSQQMQFAQRQGAAQEGTSKKKNRTDMEEIQATQGHSQVTVVKDDLFGTLFSMGHFVSTDVFIGAGIAKGFDKIYPGMKTEAPTGLTPASVFAFFDYYSRRCI